MFLFPSHPSAVINKRWKAIFAVCVLFALGSCGITALFPFEYRADAQVLIISKSRYGVDPYTVVKSAERVGENIAEVMKTDDFFEKVTLLRQYPFDRSVFEEVSPRVRRRRWQKAVSASVVYGTGVLNVGAYGRTPKAAVDLAGAVVETLETKGWEYVGGDVTIRAVNHPAATRFPARPNIFLNTFFGFLAGLLLMGTLVFRRYA